MIRVVKFSKTLSVVVNADDDLSALRQALDTTGVKAAFDDAQTIFEIETMPDDGDEDHKVGIVIDPRLMEVV